MSCTTKKYWQLLVEKRVDELGSIQKVADELGYARVSLSLALRDKYIGSTETIESAVIKKYGNVQCPYLLKELTAKECQFFKERDAPTQNPNEMRFWRVCQQCEFGKRNNLKGQK